MVTIFAKPKAKKVVKKTVKVTQFQDTQNENCSSECNKQGVKKEKMQVQERVGDWTCQRCFNHNFSFRDVCNMCYLSHIESNKMLY